MYTHLAGYRSPSDLYSTEAQSCDLYTYLVTVCTACIVTHTEPVPIRHIRLDGIVISERSLRHTAENLHTVSVQDIV